MRPKIHYPRLEDWLAFGAMLFCIFGFTVLLTFASILLHDEKPTGATTQAQTNQKGD